MGFSEIFETAVNVIGTIIDRGQSNFDRQVRSKCDEIDSRLDSYESSHPEGSAKASELRQKNNDLRNKHS